MKSEVLSDNVIIAGIGLYPVGEHWDISLRAMGAGRGILSGMVVKEALTVNLLGGLLGIAASAVILFSFSGLIGESLGAGFVLPSTPQTVLLAILALLSVTVSAALAAWSAGKKVNHMDASLVLKEGE